MSKIYQKTHPVGKNAGFTLIELLVVVLIIGILAAVALPKYQQAVLKTRLMKYAPFVKVLVNAEETYWMANGMYTPKIEDLDINFPGGNLSSGSTDTGFAHFPGGVTVDLLVDNKYVSASNSTHSYVSVIVNEDMMYIQYLNNSSYPGQRFCARDEELCKSLGGTGNYTLPGIGSAGERGPAWKLP